MLKTEMKRADCEVATIFFDDPEGKQDLPLLVSRFEDWEIERIYEKPVMKPAFSDPEETCLLVVKRTEHVKRKQDGRCRCRHRRLR